jgi:Fe-S-cluster containining protein
MDFNCQRCGWCCKNININVSYSDIIRWAKEKRFDILSEISYIDHEDKKKKGFYILKTVTAPKSACPYLTTEDGLSSCSIYDTKPRACIEFPNAHAKDEKKKIECPARGDFELDEKTLFNLKRDQSFDFMLAEDRKEKLIRILAIAKDVHEGLGILKEFGDDPTETLKVTTMGTEKTAWTEVGTLHLQEQDEPTHYIWTATKKAEHGDFAFANTAHSGDTLNSVTLYVYAKNAIGGRVLEYYIWNGASWTEYNLTPGTTYGWLNIAVPVLDTWTKVDGAKLYVVQPNQADRTDIDAAYLLCDYTTGEVAKGFSDSGSGSDVFAKAITFQTKAMADTGAGADVFTTPYRVMGFTDTGSGSDVFTIPWKLVTKAFADSSAGADVFTVMKFVNFTDSGTGTDVMTLTKPMNFIDSGSGNDVFSKVITQQAKSFIDSGAGVDVFDADWKALDFSDTGSGVDVFTVTMFLNFADSGSGTDVFSLTKPVYFTDSGSGADVFSIDYKEMGFDDVGSGSDNFTIVYKTIGFDDVGSGAEVFEVMVLKNFSDTAGGVDVWTLTRPIYFTDVGSGTDVFSKTVTFQTKSFVDSGAGADVFDLLRFLDFVDSGTGTDTFILLKELDFTDSGSGSDVFSAMSLIVNKYMTDVGAGTDIFTNPFRAVEFTDTGYGTDIVNLLRMVDFNDTVGGTDVFTLLGAVEPKNFSDTGTGSDVFASVQVIDMAFDDTGTGIDVFSDPVKLICISDSDKIDIANKVWDKILDNVLDGSAGDYLTGVADAVWDEDLSEHGIINSASVALRGTTYRVGTLIYDGTNGLAGTGWPIGTTYSPTNNLTDALLIMKYGKVNDLVLKSDLTVGATHDISNCLIRTIGLMGTDVILIDGCTANQTSFRNVNLSGVITAGDELLIYDSSIGNLENFRGIMNNVAFAQGSEVTLDGWAVIIDGTSGGEPTNEVEFDIGTASLNMAQWTGNLKLKGKTGMGRTVINCTSGNIIIDSTCTNGVIQLIGNGMVEADNSGPGCTVDTDAFISVATIVDAVWDELLSEHGIDGSTGEALYIAGKMAPEGGWMSSSTAAEIKLVRDKLGDAGNLIAETIIDEEAITTNMDTVFTMYQMIYEVNGIWLITDAGHTGTNYYVGDNGAFDSHTGMITLHTSLPSDNEGVLISYTYFKGLHNDVITQFLTEAKMFVKKYTRKDYTWSQAFDDPPDEETQIALWAATALAAKRCLEALAAGDILQLGFNFRLGDLEIENMVRGGGFQVQAHIDMLNEDVNNKLAMLGRGMYFSARTTKTYGRDHWGYKRRGTPTRRSDIQ